MYPNIPYPISFPHDFKRAERLENEVNVTKKRLRTPTFLQLKKNVHNIDLTFHIFNLMF